MKERMLTPSSPIKPALLRVPLGRTGLTVSRLSFGTVYFSPGNDHFTPEAGADLLKTAFKRGVNTWDTSDDYDTHAHVACALRQVPRERVIISSKITNRRHTLDEVLEELGTSYLDILLDHCISKNAIETSQETIRSWLPEKVCGRARVIGLSTHSAEVARLACEWPEVDVLMLPINASGVTTSGSHFEDGGVQEMLSAAQRAAALGKGVIAIKVMGGGSLANDPASAMSFAASLPYVHSLCIGMRSSDQVEHNLNLLKTFSGVITP